MWHKPKRPPSGAADVRAAGAEPPRPLHCTSMHCRPRTMDVQPHGCSSVCPAGLQSCSNPIFSSDAPVPSFWNRNAMFTLCCNRLGSVSFGVFVCFYSDSQIRIGCESGQCGTVQSTWTPEVVTELNAFHRSLMMTRAKRYALNVPSQALLCFGFCLFNCLCVVRFHCAAWLSQCPLCRPAWPQTCTSSSTSASTTTPSSRLLIWTLGPHEAAALGSGAWLVQRWHKRMMHVPASCPALSSLPSFAPGQAFTVQSGCPQPNCSLCHDGLWVFGRRKSK